MLSVLVHPTNSVALNEHLKTRQKFKVFYSNNRVLSVTKTGNVCNLILYQTQYNKTCHTLIKESAGNKTT